MNRLIVSTLLLFCLLPIMAQGEQAVVATDSSAVRHQVLLQTSKGDMVVELYNDTPKHRDNFLKLVREGYYNGNLWHRVIANFMIQTGDSTTRHAQPGERVGDRGLSYTIPAEIVFPKYFHKRGALAAAREGDKANPERKSSAAQFYIVYGSPFSEVGLDRIQQRLDERTDSMVKLTPAIREVYRLRGGTPHLDGQYTVFGEVVQGLNVLEEIQAVPVDKNNRPLDDVRITKAIVLK